MAPVLNMPTAEHEQPQSKGWTRRRKTLTIAAVVAALLVAGAATTGVVAITQHNAAVTAAEQTWNTASKTYSDAALAYDEAKDARNAAVNSTAGLDPQPLLDAVGTNASAESIAALTGARDAIVAALPEGKDTKSENIATVETPKRPADIAGMEKDAKALTADAADIDKVTSALTTETKDIRALATAYEDATVGVTASLADNASKAATTYPEAAADTVAAVATPLSTLVENNEAEIFDVENLRAVSDALNAVKASHDATVAAKQAEADANGTDSNGSSNTSNGNRSGGTNNNGSTGGTNNNGGDTNNGGTGPSTPTQPTQPTTPTQPTYTPPSTNVPKVSGGNCAVVGSATATAGNFVSAPGGVTHYSLSGSGNSWSFTWYTCE